MSVVERFPFTEKSLPKKLLKSGRHPLRPFVKDSLIPKDTEVLLMDDLNEFHNRLTDTAFGFLSQCYGLFVAPNHCWAAEGYERVQKGLEKDYGVKIDGPTILLPTTGNRQYWSMIHEGLHAVFHGLPEEDKQRIVDCAVIAYPTVEETCRMLDMTHLNITNLEWKPEIWQKIDELYRGGAGREADRLYTLENAIPKDQKKSVDEYVANFFANNRVANRWDPEYLAPVFKSTLTELGYNMESPPKVVESPPQIPEYSSKRTEKTGFQKLYIKLRNILLR